MRLWSLHPSYLDAKGLVALWREELLARKVLMGETKGYRNHPQLTRFRNLKDPLRAINAYLEEVSNEGKKRGYKFDEGKITKQKARNIPVNDGQILHELEHLKGKLAVRDQTRLTKINEIKKQLPIPHPLFTIVKGPIETWEIINDDPKAFPYDLDFKKVDFRKHPELYKVGKGEQGVLLVEPYKSEILPFWRFKNPEIAEKSAKKIYTLFLGYKKQKDFVGMDMARKFLQMGYTRSRRYANHSSGKKYEANPQNQIISQKEKQARTKVLPQATDWNTSEKAESARIFYGFYLKARNDKVYAQLKTAFTNK